MCSVCDVFEVDHDAVAPDESAGAILPLLRRLASNLSDMVTNAAFDAASAEAARRVAAHPELLVMDGRGAERVRRAFATALDPSAMRCPHLPALPSVSTGRAARPTMLRCGPCAQEDIVTHDRPLEPRVPCDFCGVTDRRTADAVVVFGPVFILVSACRTCAMDETVRSKVPHA